MEWLADGDIATLKVITEMPILDFFLLLNKKIAETEKKNANAKANNQKG